MNGKSFQDKLNPYLQATACIDADAPEIIETSKRFVQGRNSNIEKAIAIFYMVRDDIRYDPYSIRLEADYMRASETLRRKSGYCVAKAVLLAALLRAAGIPSRLGFADVRNHLATRKLLELMQTDLFVYHGYTEIFLGGKWVKATPTFNRSLCERFGVSPLDFDGEHDCLLQAYDIHGQQHMEYVRDHGHRLDVPFDEIETAFRATYPQFYSGVPPQGGGDFEAEAEQERGSD